MCGEVLNLIQSSVNGQPASFNYDNLGRLTALSHDLAGTAYDLTIGSMSYSEHAAMPGGIAGARSSWPDRQPDALERPSGSRARIMVAM